LHRVFTPFRDLLQTPDDIINDYNLGPLSPIIRTRSRTSSQSCALGIDELTSMMDSIAHIFPFEISIDA
jgi:hypothetical protein